MSLVTHLSIKTKDASGELVELLPVGVELKYKLSLETQELSRSVSGNLINETRSGKVKLSVEGCGFIPDLLKQDYLNETLEVMPGIRLYSGSEALPGYAVPNSVVRKQSTSSYRPKFQMLLTHFSCEHCEPDMENESGSKWKMVLEEI